jgi:hypothetical protein
MAATIPSLLENMLETSLIRSLMEIDGWISEVSE